MDNLITRTFDSVADALAVADRPEKDGMHRTSRDSGSDGWGGASYTDAREMAVSGYKAGTARLRRALQALPPTVRESIRPRPTWGPAGSQVDMGRYLSGDPNNMVEIMRAKRQSLVLKIGIERCVSSNTSTEDIEATGASVLAVMEKLRTAGVAAEIWVTFTHHTFRGSGESLYQLRIKVQDAGRPIDMDRLAFWTVHPAALRRIAFAIEEQEDARIRTTFEFNGGGYSTPWTAGQEDFDEYAPAHAHTVTAWITDVLSRRTR